MTVHAASHPGGRGAAGSGPLFVAIGHRVCPGSGPSEVGCPRTLAPPAGVRFSGPHRPSGWPRARPTAASIAADVCPARERPFRDAARDRNDRGNPAETAPGTSPRFKNPNRRFRLGSPLCYGPSPRAGDPVLDAISIQAAPAGCQLDRPSRRTRCRRERSHVCRHRSSGLPRQRSLRGRIPRERLPRQRAFVFLVRIAHPVGAARGPPRLPSRPTFAPRGSVLFVTPPGTVTTAVTQRKRRRERHHESKTPIAVSAWVHRFVTVLRNGRAILSWAPSVYRLDPPVANRTVHPGGRGAAGSGPMFVAIGHRVCPGSGPCGVGSPRALAPPAGVRFSGPHRPSGWPRARRTAASIAADVCPAGERPPGTVTTAVTQRKRRRERHHQSRIPIAVSAWVHRIVTVLRSGPAIPSSVPSVYRRGPACCHRDGQSPPTVPPGGALFRCAARDRNDRDHGAAAKRLTIGNDAHPPLPCIPLFAARCIDSNSSHSC
jgi:hypothetical protein